MISIELKDLRLQAHHGLYAGEHKTGNTYHVDLSVKYDEGLRTFESLENTINYVKLYEIVSQRMKTSTHLLERLCDDIAKEIKFQYPFIKEINISVYKLQPPIENFEGRVGVTLHKIYEV
jgi:7,8-dihydroneopterin aldolase/epimerase/oxygenase